MEKVKKVEILFVVVLIFSHQTEVHPAGSDQSQMTQLDFHTIFLDFYYSTDPAKCLSFVKNIEIF